MKVHVLQYEYLELDLNRGRFGASFASPPPGFYDEQKAITWKLLQEAEKRWGEEIFVTTNIFRHRGLKIELKPKALCVELVNWLLQFLNENAPACYIRAIVIVDDYEHPEDRKKRRAFEFVLNIKEIVMETDLQPIWERYVVGEIGVASE